MKESGFDKKEGESRMSIRYEVVSEENISCLKDLCNELMAYQKSLSHTRTELFDGMSFETRLVPSVRNAKHNYILAAKDGDEIVGYVYANISAKEVHANAFATFFDMDSVQGEDVGCLSQFYIRDGSRSSGIGTVLFNQAMEWLNSFESVEDLFIFVSNGNDNALKFYLNKGFKVSHQILDGFITVLRNR